MKEWTFRLHNRTTWRTINFLVDMHFATLCPDSKPACVSSRMSSKMYDDNQLKWYNILALFVKSKSTVFWFSLFVLILTSLTWNPHMPSQYWSRGQSDDTARDQSRPPSVSFTIYLLLSLFLASWPLDIKRVGSSSIRKSDTQTNPIKMIRLLLVITLMLTLASAVPKPMSDMEIYTWDHWYA